ncbi:MAG: acyl--CoA ligase [Pirellulales bacterium]|nr:acyl--CoA ligase [Pirellulales bacterium]
MNRLCTLLEESALRFPDNVLIHYRDCDWSYREIWGRSRCLAAWLREGGLQKGERVGMLLPNSDEYVVAYFGVLAAGGVVVALNSDTTVRELSHTLVHCEPAVVITTPACMKYLRLLEDQLPGLRTVICLGEDRAERPPVGWEVTSLADALRHPPLNGEDLEVDPSDVAQIIYTSGTTGRPKGVTLSHRNLLANCRSITEYLQLESSDSVFVILPFCYSYGNSLLLTHVAVGGRLIVSSNFVFWQQALDLMERQRGTGFSGVPSSYAMLLHRSNFAAREFPDLRYLTCAGGALVPAVADRLRACLPHVQVFPMYGQTEAAARLSVLMPGELDAKPGSIGKGIPGVELSVRREDRLAEVGEEGEIVARGDNIMIGYWNDPEATRRVLRPEGLWTGDLGRVDEDGYIYIVSRRSDIIKSGAFRINPLEIEEVLLEMEAIAEVAVVGQPDEIQSEVLVAFVVPSTQDTPLSQRDVINHCKRNLPRHKHIRHVRFVDALPKTSNNKIKRAELRRQAEADASHP